MNRAEIETELQEYFADHREVITAYLFGSVARGEENTGDVDVAVLFEEDPPPTLEGLGLDIADDLQRSLASAVDIVVLNRAPVDLIHRVLTDGRLMIDRDPSARIRFEVNSRNAYFDLQPILREYRRITPRGVS